MTRFLTLFFAFIFMTSNAHAFCGFYVAKADADLFNKASKVILSRHENRTVITMANDYQGDLNEFAIVIPVPTVINEGQVNVAENSLIDHLDAYTAPRLVEYYDDDPCQPRMEMMMMKSATAPMATMDSAARAMDLNALGITIEAQYTVGEYDIIVLSAKQSDGLLTYLNAEGYKLPKGAEKVLGSYIKQDMKFFLAKVNLEEKERMGTEFLRPIQVAYESPKFMLPIRLGTLNATEPQDLILMTLTKGGRVEPVNYRSVKLPTDVDVPLFVEKEFGDFYRAMFTKQAENENLRAVFLEYAWDMGWCDPCAADPLPVEDLKTLGAWWLDTPANDVVKPMQRRVGGTPQIMPMPVPATPVDTFVTRMHVRYTAESFPEDLQLQETADKQNFQGRYVMRHPFTGTASCAAAEGYYSDLRRRFENEARSLANLTGWDIQSIRDKMEKHGQSFSLAPKSDDREWWDKMWNKSKENESKKDG